LYGSGKGWHLSGEALLVDTLVRMFRFVRGCVFYSPKGVYSTHPGARRAILDGVSAAAQGQWLMSVQQEPAAVIPPVLGAVMLRACAWLLEGRSGPAHALPQCVQQPHDEHAQLPGQPEPVLGL